MTEVDNLRAMVARLEEEVASLHAARDLSPAVSAYVDAANRANEVSAEVAGIMAVNSGRLAAATEAVREPTAALAAAFDRVVATFSAATGRTKCFHCGANFDHDTDAFLAHNATCERNPLVREVTKLRALLACFPAGVLENVAPVLRAGGERHGVAASETGGGQTREDHLAHAIDHVHGASVGDTSEPHIDHAIARLVLARGLELAGSEG